MVSLNLSLTENKALNQDGITALRSLSLVQGQTYDIAVSLFSGVSQVAPTVSNFSFVLSDNKGANLVSLNSISPNGSGYLFSLPLVSPAIGFSPTYSGSLSLNANGTPEIIEPFNVSIASSAYNRNTAGYVSSLNNLSSDVILAGGGSVSVFQSGQTITVSDFSASGLYYPLGSNPSGYLTSSALSPYALQSALNATGTGLQTKINTLNGQSGSWYPRTNPSGYLSSIPSDVVRTSGNQTISGVKTFANGIQAYSISTPFHAAIDVSDLRLLGNWYLDDGYQIAGQWSSTVTLTASTDPTGPTQAFAYVVSQPWGSANDGDVVTITTNVGSVDFYFRNSPSNPNEVQIANGDDSTTASNFASVVNSYEGTLGMTASWDGSSTLTLTSDGTGSSQTISIVGTTGYTGLNTGGSGTDGSSGTGTNFAILAQEVAGRNFLITELVALVDSSWSTADVEIGYGPDRNTFTRALLFPQASIYGGNYHSLYIDINPGNYSDAPTFMQGVVGTSLAARSAIGGAAGDESSGGNVTIYARGIYL